MQQNTMRPVRQTHRPTVSRPAPDCRNGIDIAKLGGHNERVFN